MSEAAPQLDELAQVAIFQGAEGIQFVIGRLKGSDTTTVQSVIFDKERWTAERARTWLGDHSMKSGKLDETGASLRFRQREPGEFETGSFRTIQPGQRNQSDDDAAAKQINFADIQGVEIFRTGTWNGDKYNAKDLDDIVAAFDRVGYRPPIKLGHKESSGDPAYGWVKALRRIGEVLLADFSDVPDKIAKAIRERRFDHVSSEIFWNLERGGKKFRRALKAVALLGAETPAVAGLKPLRESFNLDDAVSEGIHVYSIERSALMASKLGDRLKSLRDQKELSNADLARAMGIDESTVGQILSGAIDRPPDNRLRGAARLLGVSFESLLNLIPNASRESDMANEDVEALQADMAKKDEAIAELTAKLEQAEKDGDDDLALTVKKLAEDNEAMKQRLAESENRERKAVIAGKVEKIGIASLRPYFASLYDLASQSKVKTVAFTTKVDGEEKTADTDPVAVLDDLANQIDKVGQSLFRQHAQHGHGERRDDAPPVENAGEELSRLAKAYAAKHKVEYGEAFEKVVNDPENADLKSAYARS